jgi:kumamolisin
MTPASKFVPLLGTEPRSLPNLRILGSAAPDETIQATVYVRRKKDSAPYTMPQLSGQRQQLTRAEFEAQLGADPEDLRLIESYASQNGLMVLETNAARRSVTLCGTVASFSKAFAVNIVRCEFQGRFYRHVTGPIHVPAELAEVVSGVFGLENLPVTRAK